MRLKNVKLLWTGIHGVAKWGGKSTAARGDGIGPDRRPLAQWLREAGAGQQIKISAESAGGGELQVILGGPGPEEGQYRLRRGNDLLRSRSSVGRGTTVNKTVAKLAIRIETHRPQAAVGFEKQAVKRPPRDGRDPAGDDLFGPVGVVDCAVAEQAITVETHRPQAAVGFEKQTMGASRGDFCHRRRRIQAGGWQ